MDRLDEWTDEVCQAIKKADAGDFATDVAALRVKWRCNEEHVAMLLNPTRSRL